MSDSSVAVAIARLDALSADMADVKSMLREMADAVTRLARVEERQAATSEALNRAFGELAKHETRIGALEVAQPLQKQSSDWVQKLIGLILAAVIGAGATVMSRGVKAEVVVIAPGLPL